MQRRTFLLNGVAVAATPFLPAPAGAQQAPAVMPAYKRPRIDHPLPDGHVTLGRRNIVAAWFSDATKRYRHFVLGREHEASALVVATADQRNYKLVLPEDSVFEDRVPRLADIDGDGQDEIIVIRSYLKSGTALAVVKVVPGQGDGIAIIAESPPIGTPFRWMNPAGIADFDGDGRMEIAAVRTPHIAGELALWRLANGRLVDTFVTADVSNHVAGSRHQRLSAVADFDGDGLPDLAIPAFDRRSIRFLSFRGGKAVEFHKTELQGRAGEDFAVVQKDGRPAVEVGLVGGRRMVITS